MDPKLVEIISKHVYRRFPDSQGRKPRIRRQKANGTKKKSNGHSTARFLLTYTWRAKGPGGQPIPRLVRVTADTQGRILKLSSSKG